MQNTRKSGKKRLVALVLASAMIIGMLPMEVLAEETDARLEAAAVILSAAIPGSPGTIDRVCLNIQRG